MNVRILSLVLIFSLSLPLIAQNNSNPSAALEFTTTRGFLLPRLTAVQRDAISSPATGLTLFNTSTNKINVFSGVSWEEIDGFAAMLSSTGKEWMDRNLGASRVASSSTDSEAFGGFINGEEFRGHQLRSNTSITSGPVSSGFEGSNFVTSLTNNLNWLNLHDDSRWNGLTKTQHDPCPSGFRVPTKAEWDAELSALNITDLNSAFSSILKLTAGGYRIVTDGSFVSSGPRGFYWASTTTGNDAENLNFTSSVAQTASNVRGNGFSVRCIEE